MNGVVNFFRGTIQIEINGVEPQRCFNRFTKNGVAFYHIKPIDSYSTTCIILKKELEAAQQCARGTMCEVSCIKESGFGRECYGLLHRPFLLIVILFLISAVIVLPNFIWTMQVQGNDAIPAEQILQELDDIGIHFGTWIPSISNQDIKNKMLVQIPQLQWLAVNCSGGKATVLVSERKESVKTISKKQVTNLIASRDGVITDMSILNGFAVCSPGQAVHAGDILVSGYADWEHCIQATRSLGEVYALTLHKTSACMPSQVCIKKDAVETKHCVYLTIGRKRIKLFGSSGISVGNCDKIDSEKVLTLPGGYCLPVSVTVETYTYRQTQESNLSEETAWQILSDATARQIETSMVAGLCLSKKEVKQTTDGIYTLNTTAWCKEMIARSEAAQILTDDVEEYNGTSNQR